MGDSVLFVRSVLALSVAAASLTGIGVAVAKEPPRAFDGSRCTVVGTAKADVLRGTRGDDVICGLGGNDRIIGLAGDDLLDGGPGRDVLNGGPGDDLCDSQAGEKRVANCRYDDSAPAVDLVVEPGVIDATQAGGEARIVLTLDDESGLRSGSLQCSRQEPLAPDAAYPVSRETVIRWGFEIGIAGFTAPDDAGFVVWQTGQELPDDRFSWTLRDSTLTFDLRLPIGKAVESGSISCQVTAVDRLGHRVSLREDNVFEVVVDPSAARPAPEVLSLDFTPSVIDMDEPTRTAVATVGIDAPAGLKEATTICSGSPSSVSQGGNGFMLSYWAGGNGLPYADAGSGHGPTSADFALSRDGSRSTLGYAWSLPAGLAAGTYDCTVDVTDSDGRTSSLTFPQALTLVDGGGRDVEGPRLGALRVNPSVVDVGRSAQDITISVAATDASGVRSVYVTCGDDLTLSGFFTQSDDDPTRWRAVMGAPGRNRSEQILTGVDPQAPSLSAVLTVPFGFTPGAYSCSVQMQDVLRTSSSTEAGELLTVERAG